MGYVPTHGPGCFKVESYLTHCYECYSPVVYFECSCGSKVFFEPGEDEAIHDCARVKRAEMASLLVNMITLAQKSEGTTRCPMCEVVVKNKGFRRHAKRCPKRRTFFPFEA